MNKFAERLDKLMAYKGISKSALSLLLGVKRQTVSQWLSGKYEPDFETLFKICRALNTDPDYILGYDELIQKNTFK